MELSPLLTEFIYQYYHMFQSREFIIDVMTVTSDRPCFEVYEDELPTKEVLTTTVTFDNVQGKYSRPMPMGELPEHLKNDPVHAWRAETGVELIHNEPTVLELIRIYRNWLLMTDEQKQLSDNHSQKLFNKSNKAHFVELVTKHIDKHKPIEFCTLITANSPKSCVVYIHELTTSSITYTYVGSGETRIMGETDTFQLLPGKLKCYNGQPVVTTVGRFLLNVLLVELPFQGSITYINDQGFDLKGLEANIADLLMAEKITVAAYKQYLNNLYFIGHFTELCVPSYSRAALTTHKDVKKVKEELLKKYAGRLHEPDVIAEIENTLIALDKEHLKDDVSMRFYGALGGKVFNVARKKLYLTVGGIESFSKDSGKYEFIQPALEDGIPVSAIPAISNEIRKGSYNRGHETQLGGAQTKYISRVFQDLTLSEADCGAVKGLPIDFSKQNIKEYLGRYIYVTGKWTPITKETMDKYTGNKYIMRSPMYCKAKHGLCKKCAGDVFTKLSVKHVSMLIIDISSTFTTMSLKAMHGSKLELVELGDLDQYII